MICYLICGSVVVKWICTYAFLMAGGSRSNPPPVITIILIYGKCRDQWLGTLQSCTFTIVCDPIVHFVEAQTST